MYPLDCRLGWDVFARRLATLTCLGLALTSCGGGGGGSGNSSDSAVVTRSPAGAISVQNGQSRTLNLTFSPAASGSLSNLAVTTDLAALPSGWSGPPSFACPVVNASSACTLQLTYSPTAAVSGTLTLDFSYQTASGIAKTGREIVSYSATSDSNVVATSSPTGQVEALAGSGSRLVTIAFTTDGGPASNLRLETSLAALPLGWSSPLTQFTCAGVSEGNGCLLPLSFAPSTKVSGTLTLDYTYSSSAGTSKRGTVDIAYRTTSQNNVVAIASPAGQITGASGSTQNVTVTFNSDDGNPVTALNVTTDLSTLPTGWNSAANSFSCASVATGNGCQLALTYSPLAPGSGTLTLNFSYRDESGAAKTGSISIDHTATTHNNVVTALAPSGQITAVAASGNRTVTVKFDTDDGQIARSLQVTSSLSSLPAGWSSPASTFKCDIVYSGTSCLLPLTFEPLTPGVGTLPLTYSYVDNAGSAKTGSVTIPYVGTTRNNVVPHLSQSSTHLELGETRALTATFTTDDTLAATDFAITSNLNSLPSGWSSTESSLACSSVSVGTSCQLHLTYAPVTAASGSLVLGYSYKDNSGASKTGSINVPYSGTARTLYVTSSDPTADYISKCAVLADGSLAACQQSHPPAHDVSQELTNLADVDYLGGHLVIAQPSRASNGTPRVLVPSLDSDGSLSFVYGLSSVVAYPTRLTITPDATHVYVHGSALGISYCDIDFSCQQISTPHEYEKVVLTQDGLYAYAAYSPGGDWRIERCRVQLDGSFFSCVDVGDTTSYHSSLVLEIVGNRLYAKNELGGLDVCPINPDRTLGTCVRTAPAAVFWDAAFTATNAYLTAGDSTLLRCPIQADGTLGTCVSVTDSSFTLTTGIAVR